MGSNGPARLKGALMLGGSVDALPSLVLRAEENPFALPHRERRNHLPDYPGIGRLDIVIASAENEALVQLVREADIVAQPSRPGAGHFLLDRKQLAAHG